MFCYFILGIIQQTFMTISQGDRSKTDALEMFLYICYRLTRFFGITTTGCFTKKLNYLNGSTFHQVSLFHWLWPKAVTSCSHLSPLHTEDSWREYISWNIIDSNTFTCSIFRSAQYALLKTESRNLLTCVFHSFPIPPQGIWSVQTGYHRICHLLYSLYHHSKLDYLQGLILLHSAK